MATNRIQFQPGLSKPEFFARFGSEAQGEQAMATARWPAGFRCPCCQGSPHCVARASSRPLFQYSNELACFRAVAAAGCNHEPVIAGGRKPKELPEFQWINTVLGNLKTSLSSS